MDETVETIKIEIIGDSESAVGSLDRLIEMLERVDQAVQGGMSGLTKIGKQLDRVSNALNGLNGDKLAALDKLANGIAALDALKNVKIPSRIAKGITEIGLAVDNLKNVDFSKLNELTAGVGAMQGLQPVTVNTTTTPNTAGVQEAQEKATSGGAQIATGADAVTGSAARTAAELRELQEAAEQTHSSLERLAMTMTAWREAGMSMDDFQQRLTMTQAEIPAFEQQLRECGVDLERVQYSATTGADGVTTFTAAIRAAKPEVEAGLSSLERLAMTMTAWQNAGFSMNSFTQTLTIAEGDLGEFYAMLERAGIGLDRVQRSATTSADGITTFTMRIREANTSDLSFFDRLQAGFKKATAGFRNFATMVKRRIMYRAINAVISAITQGFRDGTKAMYDYSKAMGGTFAGSMDKLATSANYLKNSLGAMVAPLINMVAPVLDRLIDGFVAFLNIINQVFARLSGADTWTRAVKVATEYGEATDKATAATKKYKASLIGLDELNVLNSQPDTSGAAGAADSGKYAFEEVPVDTKTVDSAIEKFVMLAAVIGGASLALKLFNLGLSGGTAAAIGLLVAGVALLVVGIEEWIRTGELSNETFAALEAGILAVCGGIAILTGSWIPLVVAAVLMAALAVYKYWGEICDFFVGVWEGIKSLWNTVAGWFDANVIQPVVNFFKGLWTTVSGFFVGLWNGIKGVWTSVSSWFNNTVIQPVVGFFKGLWESISKAASDCWTAIKNFFSPAISWFSQLFQSIFQTINDIFYNIGVIAKGCWEIIKAAWSIVSSWFNQNIIVPVSTFFSNMWTGIKTWAVNAWNEIRSVFSTISGWINSNIIIPVTNFFSNLWTGFVQKAKSAWEGVKQVFSTVTQFFGQIFSDAWAKVRNVFSTMGEIFKDIKEGVLAGFKTVVNGLIKGINRVVAIPFNGINSALRWIRDIEILGLTPFSGIREINVPEIPLLAGGGTVASGQMFIANEAGPELVGNVGSTTGVMNNDQIVEAVSQGVYRAVVSAMSEAGSGDAPIQVYVDGKKLFDIVKDRNNRERIRTGMSPLLA